MTWYQEWFGEEYLELYSHRDADEAREQVRFCRDQFGTLPGRLLDLACGTGRHIQELQCAGYEVVGCDLSYTLLQSGLGENGEMSVVRADMRSLPFGTASFSGLVNFFTSFGYFATEEENLRVVREMSRVLKADGLFLFDYLNVQRELDQLVQHETRETPMGHVHIERWFDRSDRSFNKRITIAGRRYLERVRGYDLDEIAVMFTSHGLTIRSTFGDFDGSPFTTRSPRLIIVGGKA